jgi:excisionase family DNA binding protein
MTEPAHPRWASPRRAAEHIELKSDALIKQLVRDGELPAYPIGKGREYRVDLNELDALMKSKSYEPRSA